MPDWHKPSEGPQQPHIVQLAAALVDLDTQKTVASMDVIIKPDGWEIDPEAGAVHGITEHYAREVGVEEVKALMLFHDLWARSDFRVGFNEKFDARIIRIALKRFIPGHEAYHVDWKLGKAECAMWAAKSVMGTGKWPTLGEAHLHFFGVVQPFAHSAMGDVLATKAIYFAINQGVANGETR